MYYELYIDIFFIENFVMDYLLLLMTAKISGSGTGNRKIIPGALLGALLTCVSVMVPMKSKILRFIVFYGLISAVMVRIGIETRGKRQFVKNMTIMYISGFLMGGIMLALRPFLRRGSVLFFLGMAGYYAGLAVWKIVGGAARTKDLFCVVTIYGEGWECTAKAMIDSGNCLRDNLTGKPVSIICEEVISNHMEGKDACRSIPYCSVGVARGELPLMIFDRMHIRGEKDVWIEAPLVAVCAHRLSSADYTMLINPDLLSYNGGL